MTADKLDEMLGDPWDEANPLGYPALIAADERGELPPAAGELLDGYDLAAEFVPADQGGRFTSTPELIAVLRTVWRRDARLGTAYGHPHAPGSQLGHTGNRLRLSGLRGLEISGAEPAFRAAFLPSLLVGPFDTALRTALANSFGRKLYGASVADLPFVRSATARAFADLLALDALAPEAPGATQLAYRVLLEALSGIREILGARALLRTGPTAIFQKTARDVAAVISVQARPDPEHTTRPKSTDLLRPTAADSLTEPELLAVRDRLTRRLGEAPLLTAADRADVERHLFDIAAARYHDRRLFDPTARRIPG